MSFLGKREREAIPKLRRNVAVLEADDADTALHPESMSASVLDVTNVVAERLAGVEKILLCVVKTTYAERAPSCQVALVPQLYTYEWARGQLLGTAPLLGTTSVYHYPGSTTALSVDRKLLALVDPASTCRTLCVETPLDVTAWQPNWYVVWERGPEEEPSVSEWDVDARLEPPPIRFRQLKTRLRFVGKDAPRIAYDPDRD